jgi:hypothetical protein
VESSFSNRSWLAFLLSDGSDSFTTIKKIQTP